jgi:hypothetical protein
MAPSTAAIKFTPEDIAALELSLSPERLQPYLAGAGGSKQRAILIYERNTALSEALNGVT